MPKLVYERKVCLMHKKTSLCLYGYEHIYKRRDIDKLELGFLLILYLGILSEFYLGFDPLVDVGFSEIRFGLLLIGLDLDSNYDSYFNSTWSRVLIRFFEMDDT
jgi:hypothetical protein